MTKFGILWQGPNSKRENIPNGRQAAPLISSSADTVIGNPWGKLGPALTSWSCFCCFCIAISYGINNYCHCSGAKLPIKENIKHVTTSITRNIIYDIVKQYSITQIFNSCSSNLNYYWHNPIFFYLFIKNGPLIYYYHVLLIKGQQMGVQWTMLEHWVQPLLQTTTKAYGSPISRGVWIISCHLASPARKTKRGEDIE